LKTLRFLREVEASFRQRHGPGLHLPMLTSTLPYDPHLEHIAVVHLHHPCPLRLGMRVS
jgi:hypothetical protein